MECYGPYETQTKQSQLIISAPSLVASTWAGTRRIPNVLQLLCYVPYSSCDPAGTAKGSRDLQPLLLPFCPDKWGNQLSANSIFKSCLVLWARKASAFLGSRRWGGGEQTRAHNLLHRFHSTTPAHIQTLLWREAEGLTLAPRPLLL